MPHHARFLRIVALSFSIGSLFCLQPLASAQGGSPRETEGLDGLGGFQRAFHSLDELNRGFDHDTDPNLATPQATLAFFSQAAADGRYRDAAQALNLNLLPVAERARLAPVLAEQLHYVMEKRLGYDWEALPDRPDGMRESPVSNNDPLAGRPRRSIALGSLEVDERDRVIRLQRVRVGQAAPVWVFSAQTVGHIDALYEVHGPGPIERWMPAWAKATALGHTSLWAWLLLASFMLAAIAIAWGIRRLAARWLRGAENHWLRGMENRLASPITFLAWVLFVYVPTKILLPIPKWIQTALVILLVTALTWLAMRFVELLTEHIARNKVDDISDLDGNDDGADQRMLTYLSVGRRVLFFVFFLVGLGIVLARFDSSRSAGLSLMASAGVATVLLGIAAQPVLGNIAAGLQVALSKPIRIGDSVQYEGRWGYVEDITYTYVLIQVWDQRRLVVPLRYFVTHPFENWTMRDARVVKPVCLYADFTVDVQAVRDHFESVLRDDDDWDEEKEPIVQVTEVGDETVELRALCSAKDSAKAWDLHCRVREALVAFLRDLDGGRYLPRRRHLVERSG
ncbi:MAG: mechanosensitive ion channel protein [Sandaracinus sp.]|nr:mechanosensitive ion channel protein [Sandaracinus sp.]|tara:strand:+ start:76 stop:1779 length:1704 start_codon:yes stop_codon:yes gene_type:complete